MGMDLIEIFFLLEDEFDVGLDDASLEPTKTIQELYDVLLRALRAEGRAVDEVDVWWRMVGTIVYVTGDDPKGILPDTLILSLRLD